MKIILVLFLIAAAVGGVCGLICPPSLRGCIAVPARKRNNAAVNRLSRIYI